MLVPAGVQLLGGRGRIKGEMCMQALLFLKKSPNDPYTSSTGSEINKEISFSHSLSILQTAAFILYLGLADFLCCLCKGRDSVSYIPLCTPRAESTYF